ncbi:response regulator [Christiangramia aquimixticola]|uniref:response regulator n=1 Tax=Christiangramia aquimixticola TaxID=1697558 RepID=UPI003AA95108
MNKIYLVDDQPISNFITKKLLQLEGFTDGVIDFTNPAEALDVVVEEEKALIFLDLNMPEMNGWEFLDAMRLRKKSHPIIILSSSTSNFDQAKAKEYPCVIKYVVKPMNKKKFLEISEHLKAY